MLDPYAQIATRVQLPEGVNVPPPKKGSAANDAKGNPPAFMGCLASLSAAEFDWGKSRQPKTRLSQTLVLELDIASLPNSSSCSHRGQQVKILKACY